MFIKYLSGPHLHLVLNCNFHLNEYNQESDHAYNHAWHVQSGIYSPCFIWFGMTHLHKPGDTIINYIIDFYDFFFLKR